MRNDWSKREVEAVVRDYFAMLLDELRNVKYSKAEHWRDLSLALEDRSKGSIERKHQNISAILAENGYRWIFGYKPLHNYQKLLKEVVLDHLSANTHLAITIRPKP
jgi:hypothetical protein